LCRRLPGGDTFYSLSQHGEVAAIIFVSRPTYKKKTEIAREDESGPFEKD